MPTLRHDDVREELFSALSAAGRSQFEAFASVYEARHVAAQLAELRTQAHLTQRQAAKRAGIDQADLSRIESSQVTPSLPTLLRLLNVVGASLLLARKTVPVGPASKAVRTPAVATPKHLSGPRGPLAKTPPARKGTRQVVVARPNRLAATKVATAVPTRARPTGTARATTKKAAKVRT